MIFYKYNNFIFLIYKLLNLQHNRRFGSFTGAMVKVSPLSKGARNISFFEKTNTGGFGPKKLSQSFCFTIWQFLVLYFLVSWNMQTFSAMTPTPVLRRFITV